MGRGVGAALAEPIRTTCQRGREALRTGFRSRDRAARGRGVLPVGEGCLVVCPGFSGAFWVAVSLCRDAVRQGQRKVGGTRPANALDAPASESAKGRMQVGLLVQIEGNALRCFA